MYKKIVLNRKTILSMVKTTNADKIRKLNVREEIESIMGKGKVMCRVLEVVERYANQDCPLLFEGETGVGKGEIVKYLHSIGTRSEKDLVIMDC
ncbi:MAG TPA: sigma 54-interacting transcriptional regulator, partial [Bacteroidales bacterium]|nr:sigma 54-interacting transcriptional regulator [Bacteroidales bacterium]HOR82824.1 sigma 54-interacting transcriptional regulator [Bacteroidales bacterium]HPJ91792.1 sigma 54-interacting transcriptional regulator [Bacteroidales bacterium]